MPPCRREWAVQAQMEKRLQQAANDWAGASEVAVACGSMTELAMDVCALKTKAGSASTSATTAGQGRPSPRGSENGERCER